jgi:hypothetical protein
MAEVRLVGLSADGKHLVLADAEGNEHTIVIDERLRAGVHGHLSRLGQLSMALESRISPREIQDRVRGGESPERLAQAVGVPVERVLRFVGPVLREREHVANQARRARLAGTGGPSSLLGDLVDRAANRRGIDPDDVSWDSTRREDHTWAVTVQWPEGTTASWALDGLRHQATPLDAAARRISGVLEGATAGADTGTVREFPDFPDFAGSAEFVRFDADETDDDGNANVHQFVPRAVPDRAATSSDAATDAETTDVDGEPHDEPVQSSDLEETDVAPAEAAGDESAGTTQPGATDSAAADTPASEPAASAAPTRPPSRSARRAKVPKWDDIMFGMKPKDGS